MNQNETRIHRQICDYLYGISSAQTRVDLVVNSVKFEAYLDGLRDGGALSDEWRLFYYERGLDALKVSSARLDSGSSSNG